jgi:MFS family permease
MPQATGEYNFSKRQIRIGVAAIFVVYGTMAYFVQTLNVARPKIVADLNGMSLYSWSVSIPALVAAFVTLIYGKLSDIYGRRNMLLIAVIFSFISTILSAISPSFIFLIIATAISAFGLLATMPLVFATIGDLFPPEQRSKWIGLLNIPIGVIALGGPLFGGWVVDNRSWRFLYWMALPLLLVCLVTVLVGVPSIVNRGIKRKIDVLGCILVAIASSTAIIGLSYAGTYGWGSKRVLTLLGISLVFWIVFFLAEKRASEPIVDPSLLRNRAFMTVSIATLLSFFGQMGLMMYFPMFLQGVQGATALKSAYIVIPYSVVMSFIGVPVGFILARSKRFKWMYIAGFGLLTADMFAIMFLSAETNIVLSGVVSLLAGIALGAVPVINTMVVQNAVPKRLLGVAMGAFFFCFSMGMAIAPALLGSAMTAGYEKTLTASLPKGLDKIADRKTIIPLCSQEVLLKESARKKLKAPFMNKGAEGEVLFNQTVDAIRDSMESGIRNVFLVGAIAMLLAFGLISTIPSNSIEIRKEAPEPVAAAAAK